jgi:tRNA A37 N6-isopentenylltransferase MiaA
MRLSGNSRVHALFHSRGPVMTRKIKPQRAQEISRALKSERFKQDNT